MVDLLVRLYDLPAAPERAGSVEEPFKIRRALPLEKHFIVDWLRAQADLPPQWASECDVAMSRLPPSCFVAVQPHEATGRGYDAAPERLLGFACYDATAKGYFGPEGVRGDCRRKGIGAALLLACLRAMREEGYGYAIIGWASHIEFYRRVVGATIIESSEPGIYAGRLQD
jgi:GNAT superfamily N-acetyltransferase